METQVEKKKTSKALIVAVIILSLLVVGLGGYLVYDKVLSKPAEKTSSKTDKKTEVKEELEQEQITSKKLFNSNNNEEQITVKDKTYAVTLERIENNPASATNVLKVDGKEIYKGDTMGISHSYIKFWSIGDLIAVDHSLTLSFIDFNGNVVKKVDFWDTESFQMGLAIFTVGDLVSLVDDEIMIKASAYDSNGGLRLKGGAGSISSCSQSEATSHNVNNDSVVSGTYKLKYLGNNEFTDITVTEVEETFAKHIATCQ